MSSKAKQVIIGLAVILVAVVITTSFRSTAVQSARKTTDYQGMLAEAKDQGQPVFMEFTTDT